MKWEDVALLLEIVHASIDIPMAKDIHDAALATLGAVDVNTLYFDSQVDDSEPLGDD